MWPMNKRQTSNVSWVPRLLFCGSQIIPDERRLFPFVNGLTVLICQGKCRNKKAKLSPPTIKLKILYSHGQIPTAFLALDRVNCIIKTMIA